MMTIILVSDLYTSSFIGHTDVYAVDEQQPPMPLIQFEEFNDGPERGMAFLNDHGHHRRRVVTRMDNRSPFPPGFVVGGPGGDPLGGKSILVPGI